MIQVEIHDGPPPADSNLVFHFIARQPLMLVIEGKEIAVAAGQPIAFNQEAFDELPALGTAIDELLCRGELEHYVHVTDRALP
jgi:hypothetical protein